MLIIVERNKKGFTLVEVMIALTILLFVFLALMQTALVSIDSNMRNLLRDEAIFIAEERMSEARSIDWGGLWSDGAIGAAACPANFTAAFGGSGVLVERNFRNIIRFPFCTNRTVVVSGDNRQITIAVWWQWKGEQLNHTVSTLRHR